MILFAENEGPDQIGRMPRLIWAFAVFAVGILPQKSKRKVQVVPQSQAAALPDTKRKRKLTKPNKRKPNKRTKSTKVSSLFSPSEVIAMLKGLKNTRTK